MLKTIALTASFILSSLLSFSQDYAKQFKDLSAKNDTVAQAKLLADWEAASPKDPELCIAYFNFFVRKSMEKVVSLDGSPNNNNSFVVSDTGTDDPIAFINSSVHYRLDVLQKGFDYINQGIALHPTRLDMRFGKIYMLGEAGNYTDFTKEIITTIEYGNRIQNLWLWKEGKPLEDPQEYFLSSLQEYVNTLYNTEDDDLLPLMRQISETVIKYYPDHLESLTNIALTYLIIREFDLAMPYLLKAEQIDPKDYIVLHNIAEGYNRSGDKKNAKIYFEKIIKYGDNEQAQKARKRINEL